MSSIAPPAGSENTFPVAEPSSVERQRPGTSLGYGPGLSPLEGVNVSDAQPRTEGDLDLVPTRLILTPKKKIIEDISNYIHCHDLEGENDVFSLFKGVSDMITPMIQDEDRSFLEGGEGDEVFVLNMKLGYLNIMMGDGIYDIVKGYLIESFDGDAESPRYYCKYFERFKEMAEGKVKEFNDKQYPDSSKYIEKESLLQYIASYETATEALTEIVKSQMDVAGGLTYDDYYSIGEVLGYIDAINDEHYSVEDLRSWVSKADERSVTYDDIKNLCHELVDSSQEDAVAVEEEVPQATGGGAAASSAGLRSVGGRNRQSPPVTAGSTKGPLDFIEEVSSQSSHHSEGPQDDGVGSSRSITTTPGSNETNSDEYTLSLDPGYHSRYVSPNTYNSLLDAPIVKMLSADRARKAVAKKAEEGESAYFPLKIRTTVEAELREAKKEAAAAILANRAAIAELQEAKKEAAVTSEVERKAMTRLQKAMAEAAAKEEEEVSRLEVSLKAEHGKSKFEEIAPYLRSHYHQETVVQEASKGHRGGNIAEAKVSTKTPEIWNISGSKRPEVSDYYGGTSFHNEEKVPLNEFGVRGSIRRVIVGLSPEDPDKTYHNMKGSSRSGGAPPKTVATNVAKRSGYTLSSQNNGGQDYGYF